ncbi:MAG TPA: MBOAT family O-acyltransferase [Pyrinomonadaceae bacterium]
MLFNSLHFLLFFPTVTILYFLLPQRFRWQLLLAASCYFYMIFRPVYILVLLFTITVDYTAARLMEKSEGRQRKVLLLASILANVGILVFFKYYNFLNQSLHSTLNLFGLPVSDPPFLNILLPLGLSFHVFRSLSYTIDVYRGELRAEKHLGIYALCVMFFPILVAGPIERPQNLLPQFRERHFFEYERVVSGLQLMLWGFFQKVVIADRLAPLVNAVYNDPRSYHGISFIVATVLFAFQLYCDFAGYSNIARGAAMVMGFRVMRNFDRPFLSETINDFWKRWHISLSTWFRDYLLFSLKGNRIRWRFYFNIFLMFLVSGLWHGAAWTYVAWGAINGCYLIAGAVWRDASKRRNPAVPSAVWLKWPVRALRVLRTFALFCFSLIFFRANSFADASYIISHLSDVPHTLRLDGQFIQMFALLRASKLEFAVALSSLALLLVVEILQYRYRLRDLIRQQPVWFRWGLYYACIIAILLSAAINESQRFIYFQF